MATNLLFFTKGKPTKEIWYWEHQLMEGVKAYSKTKPINKSEFKSLKAWWNNREENEQAWRVSFKDLEKNGFNLDVKIFMFRNKKVVIVRWNYWGSYMILFVKVMNY